MPEGVRDCSYRISAYLTSGSRACYVIVALKDEELAYNSVRSGPIAYVLSGLYPHSLFYT